ncbi:MAG TPA: hypothetical protein VKJ01_29125, partial [Candidatus Solibacter sp.]|nr:hypothetical protein [Candidatus Solibacter sp.]
ESAGMGLQVSVILPEREFEGWFLVAAESIRGKRGLPADLDPPQNPEIDRPIFPHFSAVVIWAS